jgi:hypothetical protein
MLLRIYNSFSFHILYVNNVCSILQSLDSVIIIRYSVSEWKGHRPNSSLSLDNTSPIVALLHCIIHMCRVIMELLFFTHGGSSLDIFRTENMYNYICIHQYLMTEEIKQLPASLITWILFQALLERNYAVTFVKVRVCIRWFPYFLIPRSSLHAIQR